MGRAFIWFCGKQHEWFICANHWTRKSQGENRNDSPCGINTSLSNRVNLTYNICRCVQLKLVVAMGLGMPIRENCKFTTG